MITTFTSLRYKHTYTSWLADRPCADVSNIFTGLKTYHHSYLIYKHDAIDIADPSSMQDACHTNFVIDLAHRRVSVAHWYSIGARNRKVCGSIPHRDSEFFSLPHARDKPKKSFSKNYDVT